MKFEYNCNINDLTCKDFFTLIFVIVDDIYKKVVPESVKNRRNIDKLKISDSEIITIAICGEMLGYDSEKSWFSFVKKIIMIYFQIYVIGRDLIVLEGNYCKQ